MKYLGLAVIAIMLAACVQQDDIKGVVTAKIQSPNRENILTCHVLHGLLSSNTLGYLIKINAEPYIEFTEDCMIFGKWENDSEVTILSNKPIVKYLAESDTFLLHVIVDSTLISLPDTSFVRL